ncbi:MAG: DUF3267 domain-containing protein [Desulfobacterales bacterium]|nr:MAG: DUF3267 domain-containing protein [Desulfobacterales bacterium]
MIKVADYTYSRKKAMVYGTGIGVATGLVNTWHPFIDFTFRPSLFAYLVGAIITIIFLHEGVHGAVAILLGHRPIFGVKPPFFYVTFDTKVPRGHFIGVTLAPLVILNVICVALYIVGFLRTFVFLCLMTNTIGSMGDIWILLKLLPHERSVLVQDTKNGIEIWRRDVDPLETVSMKKA